MSRLFEHVPVMVEEVVSAVSAAPEGVLLDATAGGGGHARALLEAAPHLRVLAIDRDPEAVAATTQALAGYGERAKVRHASFAALAEVLEAAGVGSLSAAVFDLGVSSHQLDQPERGFSYRASGPLDMRMDPSSPVTAADVVNSWPEERLASLFAEHGEGRFARRIARAVVAARPLRSTADLAEVVAGAVPAASRRRGHPASRVFQAIRVAVNEELAVLPAALDEAIARLVAGGRCVVLSYHSGEDRIVKQRFRSWVTGGCTCPPGMPCSCGAVPAARLLWTGARRPSEAEVSANPRASSARLRGLERLEAEAPASIHSGREHQWPGAAVSPALAPAPGGPETTAGRE